MVVRITTNVLRVAAVLALILGILDWVGHPLGPILIHMFLGFIVVFSLWILGGSMLTLKGGTPVRHRPGRGDRWSLSSSEAGRDGTDALSEETVPAQAGRF